MNKTKQLLLLAASALATLPIVLACGSKRADGDAPVAERYAAADSSALSVGVMPTADCLPAFIVAEHGIAERHGLRLRLARYNARMDQDTAIVRGRIDGMFADSVNVAYLKKKHGTKLVECRTTGATWQLVAGRSSRIARLDQLGDKIIAHACYSATEWLTNATMKGVKTSADVYKVQVNDVRVRLNMLMVAAVDAAWLPEPYASIALKHGHKKIADSKKRGANLGTLAFTSQVMADKKKRPQVDLFLKCLDEAADSIRKYGPDHYADCLE